MARQPRAIIVLDGIRFVLDNGWRPEEDAEPVPAPDWRARVRRDLTRAMATMRLNDLPYPGYAPDPVLARAEQARDLFGAEIVYVCPMDDLEEDDPNVVY